MPRRPSKNPSIRNGITEQSILRRKYMYMLSPMQHRHGLKNSKESIGSKDVLGIFRVPVPMVKELCQRECFGKNLQTQ